ncbi:hypothetical protein [Rhodococcus sp. IEGM 1318]|uniref:hypothetical protein n=1 Tax=Rhodococcus sp. IEGM 1318 TaxID=3082226 RepID=UPI0029555F9B|nr:hypothetical protein [Rhodococcus sp. IEGM 1318]MDV8009547.1 hypothetical protein [Rhodococcus sp. IEGM 1318]
MSIRPDAKQLPLTPKRRGALILVFYATAWGIIGSSALTLPTHYIAVTVLISVFVIVAAFAPPFRSPVEKKRITNFPARFDGYRWTTIGQYTLIAAAVAVLVTTGRGHLVLPIICLIVGVHFYPLAWIFGQSQYWATGSAMIALAIFGLVSAIDGNNLSVMRAAVGLGSAIVLWATSLDVLRCG